MSADPWHDIQDAELSTINLMVYAHPGEGKTPFWGTGGPRLLLIDCDNGYESAMASGSRCKRAPAHTYDEMDEIYDRLAVDGGIGEGHFDWVVWDSLTIFQDRALIDDIMEDAHAVNPNQDRDVPSKREYGKDHNRIKRLVRQFVTLPINFGISCHVGTQQDQDGGTLFVPAVQGWSGGATMSSVVCGYMNVIGMLGRVPVMKNGEATGKTVHRLLTDRSGKIYARDRFDALGAYVDGPTVPKLEQMINLKRQGAAAPDATPIRRRRRRAS